MPLAFANGIANSLARFAIKADDSGLRVYGFGVERLGLGHNRSNKAGGRTSIWRPHASHTSSDDTVRNTPIVDQTVLKVSGLGLRV